MNRTFAKPQPMLIDAVKILRKQLKINDTIAEKQKKAWVNFGVPSIFFHAFNIVPFYPQILMYNTEEFLENAEIIEGRFEIPNDLCTDNKIALARCLTPETSSMAIPEPDFVVSINMACNQIASGFDFISKHKNIPHYSIKIPCPDYAKLTHDTKYKTTFLQHIKDQFKSLSSIIESEFQVFHDEVKLKKGLKLYFKCVLLFEYIQMLNAEFPAPINAQDYMRYLTPMFVTNYLKDDFDILDFYIKLYNEIRSIVEQNKKNSREREKIRIYWDGSMFVHKRSALNKILENFNASVVCGSFIYPYLISESDNCMYPDLPYPLTREKFIKFFSQSTFLKDVFYVDDFDSFSSSDLMAMIVFKLSHFKYGMKQRLDTVKRGIKQFSADAVILHMNQNCRFWSLCQTQLADCLVNELKIPSLLIQADHLDQRIISEAQLTARVEAFLENL